MDRTVKQRNQNLFDYIITNQGSLDGLYNFLLDNNIKDIKKFEKTKIKTPFVVQAKLFNTEIRYLLLNDIIVATQRIKMKPDFNIDFNIDFNSKQ